MSDEIAQLLSSIGRNFGNKLHDAQAHVYTVAAIGRATLPATLTIRPGVTDPADTDGDIPGVYFLSGYIPAADDIVQVIFVNGSPYVIGAIKPSVGRRIGQATPGTANTSTFNDAVEHAVLSCTALLLPGHAYEIRARWRGIGFGTAANATVQLILRTVSPAAVSTIVADSNHYGTITGAHEAGELSAELDATALDCTAAWTFQLRCIRTAGTSTYVIAGTTTSPIRLWVDDLGEV